MFDWCVLVLCFVYCFWAVHSLSSPQVRLHLLFAHFDLPNHLVNSSAMAYSVSLVVVVCVVGPSTPLLVVVRSLVRVFPPLFFFSLSLSLFVFSLLSTPGFGFQLENRIALGVKKKNFPSFRTCRTATTTALTTLYMYIYIFF